VVPGDSAELVVDEGHELIERRPIATGVRVEQTRDLALLAPGTSV
jgi:hypothetical protein